jgi:tRNA A-37 threonylcarbamoyl transferase component Bud32
MKVTKIVNSNELHIYNILKDEDFIVPFEIDKNKIIMDYFTPLDEIEIPRQQISEFIKKLIQVITKLHSLDIVHNDLKPSNILYQDNKIFLIDFEFSKCNATDEEKINDIHTSIFLIIISLYMSREQYINDYIWGFIDKLIRSPVYRFKVYKKYNIPGYIENFYKINSLKFQN